MGLKHKTSKSFSYAIEGIKTAFNHEPNLRIHTVVAVLVIIAASFFGLNWFEWMFLILTIFLVISLELINTVLEAVVDLVSPEIQDAAKIAKDVSASVVLLAAIFSVIAGVMLFGPKLLSIFL